MIINVMQLVQHKPESLENLKHIQTQPSIINCWLLHTSLRAFIRALKCSDFNMRNMTLNLRLSICWTSSGESRMQMSFIVASMSPTLAAFCVHFTDIDNDAFLSTTFTRTSSAILPIHSSQTTPSWAWFFVVSQRITTWGYFDTVG